VVTGHPGGRQPAGMNRISQPSRYRVVVRGGLGSTFASAFDELELESREGETSLTGCFVDQAQLHGLLDRVRDLGIAIVSVNPVERPATREEQLLVPPTRTRNPGVQNTMHAQPAADAPLGPPAGDAMAFDLARPEQSDAAGIDTALASNRAFAAAGRHEGVTVFPNLRLLVITCLDPRVEPAQFLGLGLGDAMVIRNGGGRVTRNVIDDVALVCQLAEKAVPEGPLFEVAVIHHTQCGAGALADDGFRHAYARRIGAEEADLRDSAVLDPAGTVASDVERLRFTEAVSPRVSVSGHVYDVATGLVETVIPAARGRRA